MMLRDCTAAKDTGNIVCMEGRIDLTIYKGIYIKQIITN